MCFHLFLCKDGLNFSPRKGQYRGERQLTELLSPQKCCFGGETPERNEIVLPFCEGGILADDTGTVDLVGLDVFLEHGYAAVAGHRTDIEHIHSGEYKKFLKFLGVFLIKI